MISQALQDVIECKGDALKNTPIQDIIESEKKVLKRTSYIKRIGRCDNAWRFLKHFKDIQKTKKAFFDRFLELTEREKRLLKIYFNLFHDGFLFELICIFWDVKK